MYICIFIYAYIYIYVTKLFRESETNLLQFRLSGSSGYLIPISRLIRVPIPD